jgi:hypothetical protein
MRPPHALRPKLITACSEVSDLTSRRPGCKAARSGLLGQACAGSRTPVRHPRLPRRIVTPSRHPVAAVPPILPPEEKPSIPDPSPVALPAKPAALGCEATHRTFAQSPPDLLTASFTTADIVSDSTGAPRECQGGGVCCAICVVGLRKHFSPRRAAARPSPRGLRARSSLPAPRKCHPSCSGSPGGAEIGQEVSRPAAKPPPRPHLQSERLEPQRVFVYNAGLRPPRSRDMHWPGVWRTVDRSAAVRGSR